MKQKELVEKLDDILEELGKYFENFTNNTVLYIASPQTTWDSRIEELEEYVKARETFLEKYRIIEQARNDLENV